ncbi:MAG TPA: amino acid permease [Gaiellaceae bacterium]|jgi:APA family basic amino acid/polyamine antiporter
METIERTGETRPQLKRSLGLWMATALVVGNMVGSGIFLLPASLAGEAGPVSIFAMLATGVGAMLLAGVFATLGRAYPRTGGPYAYTRKAFGDFAGFLTAWGYWIAAWVGNAAIAIAFVGYLGVYWDRVNTSNLTAILVAVGLIWLLTLVNVLGTRETGWVQLVTTVLKFVPLALIGLIGLAWINSDNLTPFAPESGGDWHIGAAATLALWAFIGLESATIPAEEVKDPERTIPRATMLGTLITALLYGVATFAIMGILARDTLAASGSPFADAAGEIWGGDWGKVVALVAMISTLGALNGWILIQGRIPMAAAEDGLFPRQLAKVHGSRRTPVTALVVSSALLTALIFMNYSERGTIVDLFTDIVLLATLTTLVPYAWSAAAQVTLFITDRELFSGVRLFRDSVIATLAFAYSAWAIWGAGEEVIAKGFMLLTAGIPVYVWMKWQEKREAPVVTVPDYPPEEAERPLVIH